MKRIVKLLLLVFVLQAFLANTIQTYSYYYDCDYDCDSPYIYDAYWDCKLARWSVDGRADKYEFILYRDGYRMTTQIVYSRSFDCYSYMNKRGYEYYFEVRPYNYRTGWGTWVSSNWTCVDDYAYRDYNYTRNYKYRDRNDNYLRGNISYARNQGPPINVDNSGSLSNSVTANATMQNIGGQSVTVPTPQTVYDITIGFFQMGTFTKINGVWKYQYLNGIYATNAWILSQGKWYYIDINGNMVTGVYTINGKTFFLNQDGSMATGNVNINGITHYFDANGVMVY